MKSEESESRVACDAYRIAFEEQLNRNRTLLRKMVDIQMLLHDGASGRAKKKLYSSLSLKGTRFVHFLIVCQNNARAVGAISHINSTSSLNFLDVSGLQLTGIIHQPPLECALFRNFTACSSQFLSALC